VVGRPEKLAGVGVAFSAVADARTAELRALAGTVADALPPIVEEVVLTGSVSRGAADELSDIEMLVVTAAPVGLAACFEHARAAGLVELGSWGVQGTPACRVSGYRNGVPIELIWWPRDFAEASVDDRGGSAHVGWLCTRGDAHPHPPR
jgi:hypothetical protein